ncbi:hypothetical protein SAMN05421803_1389 [Nocardiopsis flavescens]|uniref:Uncharacterized protein n=1 Tax=Nocardiopsis flavescens TaxID=758803 RepID=A0A1M6VXV9_9ACTN|nr:hypothetical protein [Nocardiopsis flavescens]SHK86175.1 hypothetical protein SAMN05421803_1389 [Nocardiopsis flavescens]
MSRWLPWAVGLVSAVLALGPALGRGYVLRYDMVFVPGLSLPTVLRGADGFPRAIPSDAVVAALSRVLPGDVVQSLALAAVFVAGAAGAARLAAGALGSSRAGARVAAAAAGLAYVWNPFVAERLLLGQWAVLLGYAGLPWAVAAAVRRARAAAYTAGVLRSLVPAAVGGFSSVVLTALTAGPAALWGRGGPARGALFAGALAVVSLPWLVPSLAAGAAGAATDPAGVEAFAPRADTPLGTAGSLFLLGGVWNANAVPPHHGDPVPVALRLALCLAAVAAWAWWVRRERPAFGPGLTAAAALGFAVALLGASAPGRELTAGLIDLWAGFGPLRDGQLYVAPLALLQALGLGAAVHWLTLPADPPARGGRGAGALGLAAGAGAAVLPVVLSSGLWWGAQGALEPVQYPRAWREAQAAVAADDRPGAVLVLPWSAYRGISWSGEPVVVLDPATKLFDRRTLWNDDLAVGTPDGGTVVVRGEDARAREAARVLEPDPQTGLPESLDAVELAGLGVRYVALSAPVDNRFWSEAEGFSVVVEGADMTLLEVLPPLVYAEEADISGLEVTGGLVTVGAIIWSVARSGSSLGFQRTGSERRPGARKEIP